MATLQPGEKARMYALGGIMRGGASRGGYVSSRVFISIDGVPALVPPREPGHVGVLLGSVHITDELDDTPNTCTFTVNGAVPAAGSEVRLTLGSRNSGTPLFAGLALGVRQIYVADKPANVQAEISAVDYTWLLGFTKATKRYRNLSASAIAADLVASYAAANGFTGGGIAPNLPVLDELTYTNEDLDQAMTRLARRIGGYWYVDYLKVVHLFLAEETGNGAPEPLTPQHKSLDNFVKAADRTQVLTRVYVEGRGSRFLGPVAVGDTMIPLEAVDMFAVAPDVFAKVAPQGSEGGAQWLTFTGVVPGGGGSLVGPGVGPPGAPTPSLAIGTGLSVGRYQYAYTDVTANGETLPSPSATIDVGGVIAPPATPVSASAAAFAGGVDAGPHTWTYTFASTSGETTTGPASGAVVTSLPLANPTNSPTTVNFADGGNLTPGYVYCWRAAFVGTAGGETLVGPISSAVVPTFGPGKRCQVRYDAMYAPAAGVTAVRFYRTPGVPFDGTPNPTTYYRVGEAPLSDFTFLDGMSDAVLVTQPRPAATNTAQSQAGRVTVQGISPGPAGIVARKLYRSRLSDGTQHLVATINDNTTGTYVDTIPDASLGVAPPLGNTAGNEYRGVDVSAIAVGPPGTTARRLYRTVANGAQLKLITGLGDNATVSYPDRVADASLQGNAPTSDTSGLQQVAGQVPAGSVSMVVANVAPFESGGGWAVIGNGEQVIRYTGKSGNSVVGIPPAGVGSIVAGVAYNSTVTAAPMITGIPASGAWAIASPLVAGDELYLVVWREDAARQAQVAAMVKTGPGLREEWVQDRRLSIPEARARGNATLALRPLEDVTITYTCRDLRTASGKTITVNLPAPTNVFGAFKIQSVTIDKFRPHPNQYPTFTVTASSRHFSFEDWLRRMETST